MMDLGFSAKYFGIPSKSNTLLEKNVYVFRSGSVGADLKLGLISLVFCLFGWLLVFNMLSKPFC